MAYAEFKDDTKGLSLRRYFRNGNVINVKYEIDIPAHLDVQWSILASHDSRFTYGHGTNSFVAANVPLPLLFDSYDLRIDIMHKGSLRVIESRVVLGFMTRPKAKAKEPVIKAQERPYIRGIAVNEAIKQSMQQQNKHYFVNYINCPLDRYVDDSVIAFSYAMQAMKYFGNNLLTEIPKPSLKEEFVAFCNTEADAWDDMLKKEIPKKTPDNYVVTDLKCQVKNLTGIHNKHVNRINDLELDKRKLESQLNALSVYQTQTLKELDQVKKNLVEQQNINYNDAVRATNKIAVLEGINKNQKAENDQLTKTNVKLVEENTQLNSFFKTLLISGGYNA